MKAGQMKTAVIGGGAAGFFLAVNLKEAMPEMEVTIFERSHRVLSKVAVSGAGAAIARTVLLRCETCQRFTLVVTD